MYEIDIVLAYVLWQIWYCCLQNEQTVTHQSKSEVTGEISQKTLNHWAHKYTWLVKDAVALNTIY